jgi:hypothetical protein
MIFTFLIIAIVFYFIFGKNIKENLINLTSDHYGVKKNLNKCCENEKCYDKPHYLNSSECNANIDMVKDNLFKSYQQQYTQEEYHILVDNIKNRKLKGFDNLTADVNNPTVYYSRESIKLDIPQDLNNTIDMDTSFETPGYAPIKLT